MENTKHQNINVLDGMEVDERRCSVYGGEKKCWKGERRDLVALPSAYLVLPGEPREARFVRLPVDPVEPTEPLTGFGWQPLVLLCRTKCSSSVADRWVSFRPLFLLYN